MNKLKPELTGSSNANAMYSILEIPDDVWSRRTIYNPIKSHFFSQTIKTDVFKIFLKITSINSRIFALKSNDDHPYSTVHLDFKKCLFQVFVVV